MRNLKLSCVHQVKTCRTCCEFFQKEDYLLFNFTIDNQHIEAVEKYKYLGVILSYNGNLKHAAEHMCNKGLKAVFSLKSKILDFEFSSI
jgi:hypothetical protein